MHEPMYEDDPDETHRGVFGFIRRVRSNHPGVILRCCDMYNTICMLLVQLMLTNAIYSDNIMVDVIINDNATNGTLAHLNGVNNTYM